MEREFDRPAAPGQYALKYDFKGRGRPEDVLPLWVADMEFRSPPGVLDALRREVERGNFGYSEAGADSEYAAAIVNWFEKRFGWKTEPEWIVKTPGVMNAIHAAIRAMSEPGEAVLIQQPVYYPFPAAALSMGRRLVVNELVRGADGAYCIDFDELERQLAAEQIKVFLLCSPHNPVGRVWTREELLKIGALCLRYGVFVIADEIHMDFVYPGAKHCGFANLAPELAEITVTCTSPSKTFNLAGLHNANTLIQNAELREKFKRAYAAMGLSQVSLMGIAACQAAYETGAEWVDRLVPYLNENLEAAERAISEMPGLQYKRPEGTYFAWVDCRALGLTKPELDAFMTEKAKLWVSMGHTFGRGGDGFVRLNLACPRSMVEEAMKRLRDAVVH